MKINNDSIQKVKAFFKVALLLNLVILISPSAKASDFMTDIDQIKQEMLNTNLEKQFAPKAIFASTDSDLLDDDNTYAQRRRRSRGARNIRRGARNMNRNLRRTMRRAARGGSTRRRGNVRRRGRRNKRGGNITLICSCKKKKVGKKRGGRRGGRRNNRRNNRW